MTTEQATNDVVDLDKIRRLIALAEEAGLAELEVSNGVETVRFRRAGVSDASASPMPVSMPVPDAGSPVVAAPEAAAAPPPGRQVSAPLAGTFYGAPAPGEPAFVSVGSIVQAGDTLCIIESMKMMNPVLADFGGTIVAVLLANETPVEIGHPLFVIA